MNYTRGLVAAFELLILVSTLATLLPYAVSALAAIALRRAPSTGEIEATEGPATVVALIALLFSLFAIAGSGWDVALYGLGLLLLGLPVRYLSRSRS